MKSLVIFLLAGYKKFISPVFVVIFGHACRYEPTCSDFSITAVEKYGVKRGILMSTKRILTCNPFFEGGYKPVK